MIKRRATKFKIRATAWIAGVLSVRPLAVLISGITTIKAWAKIHGYCPNGTAKLVTVVGGLCVVGNAVKPKIIRSKRKPLFTAVSYVVSVTPRFVVIRVSPAIFTCITVAYGICNY